VIVTDARSLIVDAIRRKRIVGDTFRRMVRDEQERD
jgi:hypothetical protein